MEDKIVNVFMAYIDNNDDTSPHIAICKRTWRPCTIIRFHEPMTVLPKKYVASSKGPCSHAYYCIDHWCPHNHTAKDYLETLLSPSEQQWFKENWVNIVDQCKRVFDRDPTKLYANLSLNPETKKYELSGNEKQ